MRTLTYARGARSDKFRTSVNEFEVIERFFQRAPHASSVHLGVGDDAALVAVAPGYELAASMDMLVASRHFFADTDPEGLGHKCLAVNLSDMAAMGAMPRWALLAGALPQADASWLAPFARGFFALADEYGVDLIGGDTTCGPLNLCVTILGEVPAGRALRRSGAQPGDDVYVSGSLGDAALALAVLKGQFEMSDDALRRPRERLERPTPRVALGLALSGIAHAAIDISDGLVGDLAHIVERSGVGAEIDIAALPRSDVLDAILSTSQRELALRCLLAGGDDYELCFTAPASAHDAIHGIAASLPLPLTRIGHVTGNNQLVIRDEQGNVLPTLPQAFDHFMGTA